MENMSQALLIAAGILVGILIISMGVYLFSQAAAIPRDYNEKLENDKLAAFNEKFEVYNREDVTAQDIVTVINLAVQNNRKYNEEDVDYYITVYLDGILMNASTEDEKINILSGTEIEEGHLSYPYKCKTIEYSEVTGRVISMKFEKE